MHVVLSHFSDVSVKAGTGTEIGVLNPPEDGVFLLAETVPTQLTVTNNNEDSEVRFMPVETNNGAAGPITYDMSTIIVPAQSSNYQRQEITFDQRGKYRWASANVCGMFDNPGDDPRNFYEHEGCSPGDEAQAQAQVEVSYTADDGTVKTRVYNAAARANEGSGPIDF